ncbi:Signal transduction histidine kinase [Methylocella tundrae]|uniref:histidine kinase n=1 Tax=Methylocella tundrae TaxID=227605 RepID=A0A8B6M6T1_METTU|nr:histidine kinase dimerization/phosphoacceptor domain -containing protein [Methylocella tundrae]VTZ26695.1 Signal transduction histidine kinase [Methylocella tundrae]VTZ50570.1 Signal transduction histidine kinase [Methylocella tundrae]
MTKDDDKAEQIENLLTTPDLAGALESEQFRRFLDQVPVALIVSEMAEGERIVYVNPEFEKLSGQAFGEVEGRPWGVVRGRALGGDPARLLGQAIIESSDHVGSFMIERPDGEEVAVEAYSNTIEDDAGITVFRLAALVCVHIDRDGAREEFERQLREKDTALREIQHRVRNNLQMITALIRYEAKTASADAAGGSFDKIAGRIEALQLLYNSLGDDQPGQEVDLGAYLTQIASAVMRAHATEGVRLDLKVDAYPVSVNVAMPTGLVVNELLTNALKHAFPGREQGTISLQSLTDSEGCRVVIADDGAGLPEGDEWPKRGKLSALIVRSLRENAKATLTVESSPGRGMRVTIFFTRAAATPEAAA